MEENKFSVMLNILKMLEIKKSPAVSESVLEIISAFENSMTPEQKAKVLDDFIRQRNVEGRNAMEHENKMEEIHHKIQMRALVEPDFSAY